jgi:hypothetical protein
LRNTLGQDHDGGGIHLIGEHVGRREELSGVGQLTRREAAAAERSLQQYIDPLELAAGVADTKCQPGGPLGGLVDRHRFEGSVELVQRERPFGLRGDGGGFSPTGRLLASDGESGAPSRSSHACARVSRSAIRDAAQLVPGSGSSLCNPDSGCASRKRPSASALRKRHGAVRVRP